MNESVTGGPLLVALFLCAISLPLAANLAGVDGGDPGAENRELAAFPSLEGTRASIAAFPAGFGLWFDDHFGFRSLLVRWYGETRLFGLDVSPTAAVVKGRDGWFFYGDDKAIDDYASAAAHDARRAGELARGDRAGARLAPGARDRLCLHHRARQARDLQRGDASDARARDRRVAGRSAVHDAAGHRPRRGREAVAPRGEARRPASTIRPTRTGTIEAGLSRTSGSSRPCARGCRPRRRPGCATISNRWIASLRGWTWPA